MDSLKAYLISTADSFIELIKDSVNPADEVLPLKETFLCYLVIIDNFSSNSSPLESKNYSSFREVPCVVFVNVRLDKLLFCAKL